jgi:hypothetical protein
MNEPRFGNRRNSKKISVDNEMNVVNEDSSIGTPVLQTQTLELSHSTDDILSFMEENQKKRKVIPMRQVIFRLPVDKFEKIEMAIGSMSLQQFYTNLTEFYLSKIENSSH